MHRKFQSPSNRVNLLNTLADLAEGLDADE